MFKRMLVLLTGALWAAAHSAAGAQTPETPRSESVTSRARPEYDAPGLRLGPLMLRPQVSAEVVSTDNVFFEDNGRSDVIFLARPQLNVETTWSRHAIRAQVGGEIAEHNDFRSENRVDEFAAGEIQLDFVRGSYVTIGGSQAGRSEFRGAPDSNGGAAKIGRYEVREAFVRGVHEFNRLRVLGGVTRTGYNYRDTPLRAGGVLDQDVRDYTETKVSGRFEYAVSPDTAVFVEGAGNTREYRVQPPRTPFTRDSKGSSVLVGGRTRITDLLRGEAAVGFLQQEYDSNQLGSVDGLALNAKVEYFLTQITTVTFSGASSVQEAVVGGGSSFLLTEGGVRVDHELLRNVIISASFNAGQRDFNGTDRKDELLTGEAGLRWLVNRRVWAQAGYGFERANSGGRDRDRDYDVNRLGVTLGVKL